MLDGYDALTKAATVFEQEGDKDGPYHFTEVVALLRAFAQALLVKEAQDLINNNK